MGMFLSLRRCGGFLFRFVCCHTKGEKFSQSSACLCVLCVGFVRKEVVRETLYPFPRQYQSQAIRPLSVKAMTLKTQIKDGVQHPVTAVAFVTN